MKSKKFLCSIFIFFFSLQAGFIKDIGLIKSLYAQEKESSMYVPIKIRRYLISHSVNGSVAVVRKGKVLFNEGLGVSDIKKGSLNQASTTFPIGSITKLIVATCILQLQEKGMLRITDPVSKYIPNFSQAKEIRLIHLLNHTSGIKTPPWREEDTKPIDIINRIQLKATKFPAGTRWDYNDINYIVLGYIVEKVSGTTLHEYIQKNIMDKALMKHSGFITYQTPKSYTTSGHHRLVNQLVKTSPLNINQLFGCADIYATALDICLFDQALMDGRLINKKSLQLLLTPGSQSDYGLGLYIKDYKVYSRGVVNGFESFHAYYHDGTAITILLNVRDNKINIHQISKGLYAITH